MASDEQTDQNTQQSPQQQQPQQLQPNDQQNQNQNQQQQTILINACEKEKKKVRRAFSMPRNPFRLSRRFKSKDQNHDNESVKSNLKMNNCNKQTTMEDKSKTLPSTAITRTEGGLEQQQQRNHNEQDNKHRMFRRSAWKKFLSRIAQQMTAVNIGVSVHPSFHTQLHTLFIFKV